MHRLLVLLVLCLSVGLSAQGQSSVPEIPFEAEAPLMLPAGRLPRRGGGRGGEFEGARLCVHAHGLRRPRGRSESRGSSSNSVPTVTSFARSARTCTRWPGLTPSASTRRTTSGLWTAARTWPSSSARRVVCCWSSGGGGNRSRRSIPVRRPRRVRRHRRRAPASSTNQRM